MIFDELVLAILLSEFDETLHGSLYLYKLAFITSGVSVASLGDADDPLRRVDGLPPAPSSDTQNC